MKRMLFLVAVCSIAVFLMATPGPHHKISWCHLPPGNPANIQILEIDVAADGSVGPAHQNHAGDGPVCYGPDAGGFLCSPVPILDSNGKLVPSLGDDCNGHDQG